MVKKIVGTIIFFIIILMATMTISSARTIGDIRRLAEDDLESFLSADFSGYTNGQTDASIRDSNAAYCLDHIDGTLPGHNGGNGKNMKTMVIDVGKGGIDKVNGLSTKDSVGAQRAMEILYYAIKSYINNEPWGATNRSPYRMMMLYKAGYYSSTLQAEGFFDSSLPIVDYDIALEKFAAGKSEEYTQEARDYISSTVSFAFKDKSSDNVQTIVNKDNLIFIGPYKIANSGAGSITDITVKTASGTICHADGWSTTTSSGNVNWNKNLPNGSEFYIVFSNQKPDSAREVKVYKKVENILVGRMVYCASDGGQNIAIYGGDLDTDVDYEISLPDVPYSFIKLVKKDEDSNKLLANVGFIVYNETEGKWVKDGTPAQYVDNKDDATVYISNSRGEVNIRNLSKSGKYTIYEIIQPYFGYEETNIDNPSNEIVANISAVGQTVNLTMKNKRKYIKLSGYVWEDIISSKASTRNYLYNQDSNDDQDKLIENMMVSLRDSKGNLLQAEDGHVIQPRRTDAEGKYIFGDYFAKGFENEKVLLEDVINGAYIEFEYNGMTYKSIPLNPNVNNGSKATDETSRSRSGDNNQYFYNTRYATITSNEATDTQGRITNLDYDFSNNKSTLKYSSNTASYIYGYEGQLYPIDGIDNKYKIFANTKDANNGIMGKNLTAQDIYSNNMEEIPYINLGIMPREMPDLAIMQDIQNAKVTLNGYEHIYQYAQRFDANGEFRENGEDGFNVSVKFGDKYLNNSYTREIYSSDIIYNQSEAGNGKLDVYITYKIAIRNEATEIYTRLNELANYYDENFELVATGYEIDGNGNVINSIPNTIDSTYNQNGYKKSIIYAGTGEEVPPIVADEDNTVEIYVQYKLNNDAVNKVLNEDVTLSSVTEVVSYSSFENGFNTVYSGVDKDSRPNSVIVGDRNTYEDDTDSAPTLILKATNTRMIQGTIWEDNAIQELIDNAGYDKRREGDGRFDASNENVVRNVKVELLEIDSNGDYVQAKLYQRNQESGVPAQYTTQSDGRYVFEGVIPGKYLLKYTYGNESYVVNIDDGTETQVDIQNYKSTKFRDGNKQEAEDNNLYWYREETGEAVRLSDARDVLAKYSEDSVLENKDNIDIVDRRTTTDLINYAYVTEETKLEEITAETKKFEIKLDYDVNLDNISEYGINLKFDFNNIDLGIIRRAVQPLKIKKEISYIEVVLANGQTLIKGDPRNETIPNVKLIPQSNNQQVGRTVYLEIDGEIIQGATLNVEYELTVDLTACEVDYNSKDYYYYNIIPENYNTQGVWRMSIVTDMFDYISNDLNYDADKNNSYNWESIIQDEVPNGYLSQEVLDEFTKYNKVIHTDYFSDMNPENRVKTMKLNLTRLLSNNAIDFTFDNDIETVEIEGRIPDGSTPGNYEPSESPYEPDESEVQIIITGPTGGNYNYMIYGILGIIVLIIFTGGIIFIKKVLKKNKN